MTTPLNTKDVAEALGVEAKALRVFLRSPGAEGMFTRDGKAYVFTKANVAAIKKGYATWTKDRAASKVERDADKARALAAVAEETVEAIAAAS